MMRIWLARDSALPIREQLASQLLLGILSRTLQPGERLPSVRELARRLDVHANTVSAAYRDLACRGWVETRSGSGVFVREPASTGGTLDHFIAEWVNAAKARGYAVQDLLTGLQRINQPQALLVVDSDPELARILAAELSESAGRPIAHAGIDEARRSLTPITCVLVNAGHVSVVGEALGGFDLRPIHLRSLEQIVQGATRPTGPVLIGIASRSSSVREWAATLMATLGIARDALLLRDPARAGWRDGLGACHLLAADVVAAAAFPAGLRPITFRIVSSRSLEEVRQLVTVQIPSQPAIR